VSRRGKNPAVRGSAKGDRITEADDEVTSQLARSQHARRERIIGAVLELAAEGGYDAVQVRDVADRAGVALGTIYNYYESRENLIYGAMIEWRRQVASESVTNVRGRTLEARLLSLLRHTFEAYAEAPLLFETFTRLGVRPGEQDPLTYKIQVSAMDEVLAGSDPAWADDFRLILGNTVYASLSMAGQGQLAIEDVWPQIARVVKRLVACRPDAG
jgi:TetR/AcrR family transcriptional regulator, cholesterol catabolism regulator